MFRHLPLLFSCCACLLLGTCSKEEPALLPGEIVLNASELPGSVMEWKMEPASERILTINLDNPLLPWSCVHKGLQEAYGRGVNDIRLRKDDVVAPAFANVLCRDYPRTAITSECIDLECLKDIDSTILGLPEGPVMEHPCRENVSISVKKAPSTEPSYPFVEFIQPSCSGRDPYPLIHWHVRDEGNDERRKNDVQAFARMANADIRQHRAFIFLVEDEVPCGEVFDYLDAINGRGTLLGVSFSCKDR